MKLSSLWIIVIAFIFPDADAQEFSQTIKGKIVDQSTQLPLFGASVLVMETDPALGAITDTEGYYSIANVPLGRYDIRFSYVGYEVVVMREVLVSSGKEVVLNVGLKESIQKLEQVEIKAQTNKNEAINSMATISAGQLNMEEANRFAGGFDDPARLVSAFAGVTSSVGSNGIVIRGNSPKGLLWRMEGVQISNPNHFADYISLGGGAVTALSSQTLGASDFFTGAFPAEFGNALSGVFDMNLRSGNQDKREHTFQASLIGIDLASEGPFKKGKSSTYLFNYRYSTLGLLSPILPEEMGKLSYQDLSFKIDFPARNGVFSVWGIGAYDFQGKEAVQDPAKWKDNEDREEFKARLNMGALGVNYKKVIGKSTYMRTTLAVTENSLVWKQKRFDSSLFMQPIRDVEDYRWKYSVSAMINHKFSARHTNRTGVILNRIMYDLDINYAEGYGNPLKTYISEEKGSELLQFYSQSKIHLNRNVVANVGLHSQYFTLNGNHTLEPRLGLSWNFNPRQALSLAYGMHSQLELLQFYFVEQNTPNGIIQPNKNLDFNKAHHFVVAYENQLKENLNLTIETYYQKLFDIPVVPGSHVSTININEIWDFNDSLVNQGTGENIGLDITLERYLNQGLYYMLTASFFDSKYTGGDGIKRNTKYNRGYVVNVLAGKEWKTGKKDQNLLNANIRLTHMGGRRIIPVDTYETLIREEIILDISRAYEQQLEDAPILSASFNLRINKRNHASVWSFHIINALGHKEFQEFEYNAEERKINKVEDLLIIPNIGYKIEF